MLFFGGGGGELGEPTGLETFSLHSVCLADNLVKHDTMFISLYLVTLKHHNSEMIIALYYNGSCLTSETHCFLKYSFLQLEGSNEVRLWNNIFVWAQMRVSFIICTTISTQGGGGGAGRGGGGGGGGGEGGRNPLKVYPQTFLRSTQFLGVTASDIGMVLKVPMLIAVVTYELLLTEEGLGLGLGC